MDRLLLLGSPASGTGTQAALLAGRYALPVASTGQMLLDEERLGTDIGKLSLRLRQTGAFVPDPVILEMVMHWVARHGTRFVFDGFPRTLVQAEAFQACLDSAGLALDAAIVLHVPEPERRRRTFQRVTCAACGTGFDRAAACPACGGGGVRRPDDAEHVFDLRAALFEERCVPVLHFYRQRDCLVEIDGAAEPATVFDHLGVALAAHTARHVPSPH
ncbi:adenylate kinase [soil metagenome]